MKTPSLAKACGIATVLLAAATHAEVDFSGDFSGFNVPPVQLLKHNSSLSDIAIQNIFDDSLSNVYEIELVNDSYKTQNFKYNSTWYDRKGKVIKSSKWTPATLSPGAELYLEQAQPQKDSELIIHLKY